jgi:hypothetical protein
MDLGILKTSAAPSILGCIIPLSACKTGTLKIGIHKNLTGLIFLMLIFATELGLMPLLPLGGEVSPVRAVPKQKCDCGVEH